jgi:hypothetical protein
MTRGLIQRAVICSLLISGGSFVFGQDPANQPPAEAPPPAQPMPPEQLDSLVAPVALYPDSLLSQVLVASTYPLELVEANQWLQQNGNLQGSAMVDAAQQQNWDPSIQALVPFPDVIKRLTSDIRWTTDLGNAFLAQQGDVMDAVQRMRARARDSGKLTDTPQQRVEVQSDNGQQAIEIQPVDPQVVYVPVYNPDYFWGPPPYYPWPGLYYPAVGIGWNWGFGVHLGFFFGGCCGWGGWGWGPGWFNHTVVVNNYFFHRYNFRDFDYHGRGDFRGTSAWAHDPGHRQGVPYANGNVAARFQGANRFQGGGAAPRAGFQQQQQPQRGNFNSGARPQAPPVARPESRPAAPAERLGNRQIEQGTNNHSAFGGSENGGRARVQSDHGFSSMGPQRTAPAFHGGGGGAPAPRSAPAPAGGGGHRGR